jgi:hypothetical protein
MKAQEEFLQILNMLHKKFNKDSNTKQGDISIQVSTSRTISKGMIMEMIGIQKA